MDSLKLGSGKMFTFYTESQELFFKKCASALVLGEPCVQIAVWSDIGVPQIFFGVHLWRTNCILSSMAYC